ncbi:MAG: TetR/AcrR family transcriptional regulator [Magnetovibrio sp.]|nr:TetR/AcrR family transcriptional regulator [Magnetovibrio sp.]
MHTERAFGIVPPMVKSEQKSIRGEDLKAKVLQTTLKLFSQQGYFNTSLQDIRKSCGVSIGAIYHHFENKEALAKALFETLLDEMNQVIMEAMDPHDSCRAQSHAVAEALFQLTLDEPQKMQFILMAQHREYLPDAAPICSSRPFQSMKDIVEQGMRKKEIRSLDDWVAASTMFGGALRLMNLHLDGALDRPLMELLEETMDCAWRGLKA